MAKETLNGWNRWAQVSPSTAPLLLRQVQESSAARSKRFLSFRMLKIIQQSKQQGIPCQGQESMRGKQACLQLTYGTMHLEVKYHQLKIQVPILTSPQSTPRTLDSLQRPKSRTT